MTAAMRAVRPLPSHETWLRIGIVRGGAIVEERWLRPGRALTFGRGERADIVVASSPYDRAELLRATARGWEIVADGIAGRASRGEETIDLAAGGTIDLEDGARARIELGDVIVLVERRIRPPARAAATLPRSLRGALGIDERFTAIALGSLCLHSAFLLVAGEIDAPYESAIAALERSAEVYFIEPEMPETPVEPAVPTSTDGDPPTAPSDTSASSGPPAARVAQRGPSRAAPSARDVALLQEEAGRQVESLLIGALGGPGAIDDLLHGAPALPRAEELMRDVGRAEHGGPMTRSLGERDHAGTLADLAACDGCGLAVRDTREVSESRGPLTEGAPRRVPLPILEDPEPEPGPGDLPIDVLAREIAARRRRVQTCYEHALGSEPELAGRLVVSMRVEQVGTLSRVHIEPGSIGSDAFHACVVRSFSGFRTTAPPEGGAVDVSFPFVFAAQR